MRGYLPTTPDQMGGRGGVGEGGGEQWKELEELAQRKQVREGGMYICNHSFKFTSSLTSESAFGAEKL